jgi:ABC-type multidrug transport system fused ATPase/permease subunit
MLLNDGGNGDSLPYTVTTTVQETVRKELGNCTVICIAHRLHTIAYYDNVLVMDQGRVAECARPFELMQQDDSIFRQMCVTSGDFDELYASASDAYQQRR